MHRRRALLALAALLPAVAHAALWPFRAQLTWDEALHMVRSRFPDVVHIGTATLARELGSPETAPLLLDTRAPTEYAVSHLTGAQRAATLAEATERLRAESKDRTVVVYCSVGYRSAELARQLTAAGYTRVRNLEGSIFAWANEGRPVYRGTVEVREVHPFDERWGALLKRELHAVSPR